MFCVQCLPFNLKFEDLSKKLTKSLVFSYFGKPNMKDLGKFVAELHLKCAFDRHRLATGKMYYEQTIILFHIWEGVLKYPKKSDQ